MLRHAGISLRTVESPLIDLIALRETRSARSSLWCAAHALDASAVVWGRLQPGPLRYRELVARLEKRLERQRGAPPTATAAAVGLRTGAWALEDLARCDTSRGDALDALEDGAVTLAALAVSLWMMQPNPPQRRAAERRAMPHDSPGNGALLAVACAADDLRKRFGARSGAGEWVDWALATVTPAAELDLTGGCHADRVLRADALTAIRVAWIARAANELLAMRALPGCDGQIRCLVSAWSASPQDRPQAVRDPHAITPALAWRRHTLALAHASTTCLRAGAASAAVIRQSHTTLHALLVDALFQASILDDQLPGEAQRRLRLTED